MDVNDNAGRLMPSGAWTTIASNRASTGCSYKGPAFDTESAAGVTPDLQ